MTNYNWIKIGLGVLCAGCANDSGTSFENERIARSEQALDNAHNKTQSLTATQGFGAGSIQPVTQEADRQTNTAQYYSSVHTGPDGTGAGTISTDLNTLSKLITFYKFALGETTVSYYNRGDLGLGRNMHCVDHSKLVPPINDGQIACYVSNYVTGDGEFSFGLSSSAAFTNLAANKVFATVAMVYRANAPAASKVFYVVYNGTGGLQNFAALDRVGGQFASAFHGGANPPNLGTPGAQFNNHIPSNCMSCHGGTQYDKSTFVTTGSVFLPFDLAQFDYISGSPTATEKTAFQQLNGFVKTVAAGQGASSLVSEIDLWQPAGGTFDSNRAPPGWTAGNLVGGTYTVTAADQTFYTSVLRPTCRNCHGANNAGLTFDDALAFKNSFAVTAKNDLCNFRMPHALQTLRLFWLSSQPQAFAAYLRSIGQTSVASDFLTNCSPKDVATLDPQVIDLILN